MMTDADLRDTWARIDLLFSRWTTRPRPADRRASARQLAHDLGRLSDHYREVALSDEDPRDLTF